MRLTVLVAACTVLVVISGCGKKNAAEDPAMTDNADNDEDESPKTIHRKKGKGKNRGHEDKKEVEKAEKKAVEFVGAYFNLMVNEPAHVTREEAGLQGEYKRQLELLGNEKFIEAGKGDVLRILADPKNYANEANNGHFKQYTALEGEKKEQFAVAILTRAFEAGKGR